MSSKKTLVLGASPNPARYSHRAVHRLRENNHEVVALGVREGDIAGVPIQLKAKHFEGIDTVTMYLGAPRQVAYYHYIISLEPKRIIFNPGAENDELVKLATKHNIDVEEACTLVLLSIGNY